MDERPGFYRPSLSKDGKRRDVRSVTFPIAQLRVAGPETST